MIMIDSCGTVHSLRSDRVPHTKGKLSKTNSLLLLTFWWILTYRVLNYYVFYRFAMDSSQLSIMIINNSIFLNFNPMNYDYECQATI